MVLLLTAIVGGVGALTIGSLTGQMKTSEVAADVMGGLQDVSASREAFMRSRNPEDAARTNELITALDDKLQGLQAAVSSDPAAQAEWPARLRRSPVSRRISPRSARRSPIRKPCLRS
ncbi:MAG: hypothetical protein HPM95_01790 [Alphaproteobacteria bacterium]|nr:hypothetical protein [Alphaproteobacteria bacterium]